jgi:hypothetical protein
MALDDLCLSMERLADFMDKTFLGEQALDLRGLGKEILKERDEGGIETVKPLVAKVVGYFWGWGGGLFDLVFSEDDGCIQEGMTVESMNIAYNALLDDLFFNLLFWDTDKAEAVRIYEEMGFYFHWNPEWFKEWSDLAKLPLDEMQRDD